MFEVGHVKKINKMTSLIEEYLTLLGPHIVDMMGL